MKIDTEGTYTLTYTATDSCGNSTSENRTVLVKSPPRTVIYHKQNDEYTLIINEDSLDKASNMQRYGNEYKTYPAFDPNGATDREKYIFSSHLNVYWASFTDNITRVIIGSDIAPTSLAYWFNHFSVVTEFDLEKLDTSNVTNMESTFANCWALTNIDLSGFDTSKVINMNGMFVNWRAMSELDLSNFDTRLVEDMESMFNGCNLSTIYVSSAFDTTNVTSSSYMFYSCKNLVGGAGTTTSGNPKDKTYARIDNPPDAPGYFTLKPSA